MILDGRTRGVRFSEQFPCVPSEAHDDFVFLFRGRQHYEKTGAKARLLYPRGELSLVELVVFIDVEVVRVLTLLPLPGRNGLRGTFPPHILENNP